MQNVRIKPKHRPPGIGDHPTPHPARLGALLGRLSCAALLGRSLGRLGPTFDLCCVVICFVFVLCCDDDFVLFFFFCFGYIIKS